MNESDPHAATTPAATAPSADERQWAMFAHLSSLLGGLLTSGWAASAGFFIGPLVIWLIKKETMPFVDDQGKEALNFSITVSIAFVALMIMTIMTLGIGALLTIPLMLAVGITSLIFVIIAAIKSHEGVRYRYPVSLRLVK
jgi:uncharacterized Tic20 family protein